MTKSDRISKIMVDILLETCKQDERFGLIQNKASFHRRHSFKNAEMWLEDARRRYEEDELNGHSNWCTTLVEEVLEALAENDLGKLRAELVQVAAVAVQWIEHLDRVDGVVMTGEQPNDDLKERKLDGKQR